MDDSQVTARVTQSCLEAAGYEVQTVPDGQAALQAAEAAWQKVSQRWHAKDAQKE